MQTALLILGGILLVFIAFLAFSMYVFYSIVDSYEEENIPLDKK